MAHRSHLTLFLFIISLIAVLWPAFADGQTVALQVAPSKRNLELENRLKAALAGSAGNWGVSVKHVERNEVAGINSDQRFQMASVFKIPVLVELFYQVSEGRISLDERIEWATPERYFGSGVLVSLTPGLRPTVGDLATLMIILSDNAATDLLCQKLGVKNVTARLRSLGLSKSSVDMGTRDLILQVLGLRGEAYQDLTTKTLDKVDWKKIQDEVKKNEQRFLQDCPNCTTPWEMTLLLEKILMGVTVDKSASEKMLRILSLQQFNQRIPRLLPYDVRCAHKTGTLTGPVWMVNDAGIIFLPKQQGHLILSVFSRGSQTELTVPENTLAITSAEGRIAEIAKIAFDYYTAPVPAAN
ncbi:MAG TPA: serine hydrolase [Pyrinomonadaceae bacterium]|nr:serine hydrolase [Pyrinomonadaceae bacterium]